MKLDPSIIHMSPRWIASLNQVHAGINGKSVPARPSGFYGIRYRIRATWLVWTGRADALIWPEGQ